MLFRPPGFCSEVGRDTARKLYRTISSLDSPKLRKRDGEVTAPVMGGNLKLL